MQKVTTKNTKLANELRDSYTPHANTNLNNR